MKWCPNYAHFEFYYLIVEIIKVMIELKYMEMELKKKISSSKTHIA